MSKATFHFRWKTLFHKPTKRIEIRTEKRQTLKIRRKNLFIRNICQQCQEITVFLSSAETARLFDVEIEYIELFIVEKNVHFLEFDKSETLICLKSILNKLKNKNTDS